MLTINSKKSKINLSPVKLPKNYKGTIIVGFTDINYWPVAKLWYERMKVLNYTKQLRMYALDTLVLEKMLSEFPKENVFSPTDLGDDFKVINYKDNFNMEKRHMRKEHLHKIWKIRVDVTTELLKQGYSVLQSDIDSLWLKHVDLEILPMNFDIIHSVGFGENSIPHMVKNFWGFVICGCLVLYRPTEAVLRFWDGYKSVYNFKCIENGEDDWCDDQKIINKIHFRSGLHWAGDEELKTQQNAWNQSALGVYKIGSFIKTKSYTDTESGLKKKSGIVPTHLTGTDIVTDISDLQVLLASRNDWMRGGNLEMCENITNEASLPWIMMPGTKKRGYNKVQLFEDYKNCFQ